MTAQRALTLLDRLRAEGQAISPRERLAVAEAVAALAPDDEALSAMVASLLTHNEADWGRVQARCVALLRERSAERTRTTEAQAPPPEAMIPASRRRRWAWAWAAFGVLGVLGVGIALSALVGEEDATTTVEVPAVETPEAEPVPEPEPETPTAPAPAPEPAPTTGPSLVSVSPARATENPVPVTFITPARSPTVMLLSLTLLALGLTLLLAPSVRRARAITHVIQSRAKADALRLAGRRGDLALYIPRTPLLRPAAVDAAAGWLGRRVEDRPSPHLNVAATVDEAARRPGPVVPQFLPAVGGPPLLVWVDVEDGDHPLAWAVEAVLDRWARQGLQFERLNYNRQPTLLTDPDGDHDWPLDELARRRAGAPLLLFSRLDDPLDYNGTLDWLAALTPWPRRALIDLNPSPDTARRAAGLAQRLEQARLPRLPFTDDGLVAAAALLATGEQRGAAPPPPELPSAEALRAPLARWLVCACCVPQPTWAQLEAIRVELLADELSDSRLVQRLLDMNRAPDGAEPISSDGRTLLLPPAKVAELLAEDRRLSGGVSPLQRATLGLLIEQLDRAKPEAGTLAEGRKRLRIACYELTLGKRAVEHVLADFADSPVRDELERRLNQEDRVRLEAGVGGGERLVEGLSAEGPLGLREVATAWARVGGGRRLGGALALGVLATAVWWLGAPEVVVSVMRRVELPEEWEVVVPEVEWAEEEAVGAEEELDDLPRTALRPALVSVPGGTFLMGSPEEALTWEGDRKANEDELPQRELTIPAFQMCKTEVTQAHYKVVTGTNPSYCGYGCSDDLPVQNVSWFDAVAYLNKLTALESEALMALGEAALTACYEGSGAKVRWATGCTGYRLPTEAEWEYAARAGTTTSWSFGEDPAVIGDYAWYDGNSRGTVHAVGAKKSNPWRLNDMHGNVWEWVWDAYDSYKSGKVVYSSGTSRALRGGAFSNSPWRLRSARRDWWAPEGQGWNFGFRCARGPGPQR
ncbi:formylglycine-generating enzyme family protein [Myxococcota bacterium]|nr:formylglycine-generating enzyme family protein [Myxococcota bacterium]